MNYTSLVQKNKKNLCLFLLFISLILILLSISASALQNPAYVYCTQLGYQYSTVEGSSYCTLPSGEKTDAWKFIQGKQGQEHSFCSKKGYKIKTVKNQETCAVYGLEECAVCIVDGKEVEVSKLMGLTYEETTCGDGVCGIPENSQTCSKDCPKGGFDTHCDQEVLSDPDCKPALTEEQIIQEFKKKHIDKKPTPPLTLSSKQTLLSQNKNNSSKSNALIITAIALSMLIIIIICKYKKQNYSKSQ